MDDEVARYRRMARNRPIPTRLLEDLRQARMMREEDIPGTFRPRDSLPLRRDEAALLRAMGDGGLRLREAAEVLDANYETCRDRLKSARLKLGAKTTAQAVARAIRQDLI